MVMTDYRQRINRRRRRSNSGCFWIIARDNETGQPYLIWGGNTEEEARQTGMQSLPGLDFRIKDLGTYNRDEASARLRGKRLHDTRSLHEAARRIGHERTVRRKFKRRLF